MSLYPHLNYWLALSDAQRRAVWLEVANAKGYPPYIIEKDWWVVHTLALIFQMPCGSHLVFKGGTSLSKGWGLIERFSEDIDLAIEPGYIGPEFADFKNATQVRKLRQATGAFVRDHFAPMLQQQFIAAGLSEVRVEAKAVTASDTEPLIIEVYTPKLMEDTKAYLRPEVLVELGSRSLQEPFTPKPIQSWVGQQMAIKPFADTPIPIRTVLPTRTFWEKILLLHEEFCKPEGAQRVNRLSRHHYDLFKLNQSTFGTQALSDETLYRTIVQHRARYNPVKGVDYTALNPASIRFLPAKEVINNWQLDYAAMHEMIADSAVPNFMTLMKALQKLEQSIHALNWPSC